MPVFPGFLEGQLLLAVSTVAHPPEEPRATDCIMANTPKSGQEAQNQESQSAYSPGVISIHEIYTLEEAKARLGWTESALRAAKRRGLILCVSGKRRYLTGREISRFLESNPNIPTDRKGE
jgi:hypothetical protein